MLLSIIIVNYNVRCFLEQCLCALERSAYNLGKEAEILVVDNNSDDGSVEFLQDKFPKVRLIANKENLGFARANNQALAIARGEYILFLNPDTIVPETCLRSCLTFMRAVPLAGAIGVRMIDGQGKFLKESRRGFPTPWVSFCKLSGLTALFPHSRLFAKYYLGHFAEEKSHHSPILSGAFMLTRKEALDKAGGFDEQFFMYAEDIDLCHRIELAGYRNYYLGDITILHFKGESTLKDHRYVRLFYKAMSQFNRKYFSHSSYRWFNLMIEAAIWLRAGLTAIKHSEIFQPLEKIPDEDLPKVTFQRAKYKTWVDGDPESSERLIGYLLFSAERVLVSHLDYANEIILCEGKKYTYEDILNVLQETPKRITCKIHAEGSTSVVGSQSKSRQGEVIDVAAIRRAKKWTFAYA